MSLKPLASWWMLPVWCALGGFCAVLLFSDVGWGINPNVVITRNAGTPCETSEHHNVILKTPKEEVEVTKVKF